MYNIEINFTIHCHFTAKIYKYVLLIYIDIIDD